MDTQVAGNERQNATGQNSGATFRKKRRAAFPPISVQSVLEAARRFSLLGLASPVRRSSGEYPLGPRWHVLK